METVFTDYPKFSSLRKFFQMRLLPLLLIFLEFKKSFVNCGGEDDPCLNVPLSISSTGDTNTIVMAVTDPIKSTTMTTFDYNVTKI